MPEMFLHGDEGLVSVRFGSVRFSSVQFGSARFSSVQLGSVLVRSADKVLAPSPSYLYARAVCLEAPEFALDVVEGAASEPETLGLKWHSSSRHRSSVHSFAR